MESECLVVGGDDPRSPSDWLKATSEVVVVGEVGCVFDLRSCHSLRRSLAQEPQELKYAPAFWLAALTDAWACEKSMGDGFCFANHVLTEDREGRGVEDDGDEIGSGEPGNFSSMAELSAWLALASSFLFRCVSRKASKSAQSWVKAVLTFFCPMARCLFKVSRPSRTRSSKWSSATCWASRRWISSIVSPPEHGWRGSTMENKRASEVSRLKRA